MFTDAKTVESLVEIITHEVLAAYMEKQEQARNPGASYCKMDCADGTCVRTCFDDTGHVVNAGAERLSSTLGVIPSDASLARMIDHTLLKPDATQE